MSHLARLFCVLPHDKTESPNSSARVTNGAVIKVLTTILFSVAVATSSLAQADAKAAIISAAKKYVASNSAIAGVRVTLEKVDGKYARAKATPRDPKKADPAWVFLKKENDTWTGLTLGTGFAPEDYRKLGIPRRLWID